MTQSGRDNFDQSIFRARKMTRKTRAFSVALLVVVVLSLAMNVHFGNRAMGTFPLNTGLQGPALTGLHAEYYQANFGSYQGIWF